MASRKEEVHVGKKPMDVKVLKHTLPTNLFDIDFIGPCAYFEKTVARLDPTLQCLLYKPVKIGATMINLHR